MNNVYLALGSAACLTILGGAVSGVMAGDGDGEYACDLNWFPSVDRPSGVAVDGDLMYLLSSLQESGIQVYDFSDPAHPEEVGFAATDGRSNRLVVDGAYGYAPRADSGVIDIIDLSDPFMPMVIGSYETTVASYELDVSDGIMYIGHNGTDDPIQGLEVVDVSDPKMAVQIGVADLGDLLVRFDVEDGIGYMELRQDIGGRVDIFELSEPTAPLLLGSYDIGGGVANKIVVDGSLMYVGTNSGLQIVDVGSLASPVLLSQVDLWASDIHIAGDQIFLERVELVQVDVSNPAAPIVGKRYRSPGGQLVGVGVFDSDVVVVDRRTGLHLADFTGEVGSGCNRPCGPDLNRDGQLDFFDITAFIRHMHDYTAEGVFDFHDVAAFLADYQGYVFHGGCN